MKLIISTLILFFLFGCGGSSNNEDEEEINLNGIYTGFLDINGVSNVNPFVALISSDNRLAIIGNPGGSGEFVKQNNIYRISLNLYQGGVKK